MPFNADKINSRSVFISQIRSSFRRIFGVKSTNADSLHQTVALFDCVKLCFVCSEILSDKNNAKKQHRYA